MYDDLMESNYVTNMVKKSNNVFDGLKYLLLNINTLKLMKYINLCKYLIMHFIICESEW